MRHKSFAGLFLAFIITLAAVSCSPKVSAPVSSSKAGSEIVILYDNDVHCLIDRYACMAAMKQDMLQHFDYVAVVSSGDFSQGGPVGALSKGESVIEVMNSVGYDIVTLGNHEFDYGFEQMYRNLGNLNAEVVDCNAVDLRNGKTLFKPYVIKDFGGTKVAFAGVSTPSTITSSTPSFFQDEKGNFIYGFCKENIFEKIQQTVDNARKDGADYVILLTHVGIAEDMPGLTSFTLAEKISGIDVILDGHSHSIVEGRRITDKDGKSVLVTQTGSYMENIGRLIISPDGSISSELISTSSYAKKEPRTAALIDSITDDFNRKSNIYIAGTSFQLFAMDSLDNRPPRYMEMPLGDLCCDAFREMTGAQIAVQNGGSLRNGFLNDEILHSDVFAMLPFHNLVQVTDIPGQVILDALEYSVFITPESFGGFLQVSGLKFTVDTAVPSGVQITPDNMFIGINGKDRRVKDVFVLESDGSYSPLDPDRMYRVASTDYIISYCGNGYTMFKPYGGDKAETFSSDCEVVEKYLKENLGGVIPERYRNAQGRINIVE